MPRSAKSKFPAPPASGRALACALGLIAAAPSGAADFFADVHTAAVYSDNVTRAQADADIRADTAATLSATAGWLFAPGGSDAVVLTAGAQAQGYARFTGLDAVGAHAGVAARHKFGVGHDVPWLRASVDVAYDAYREDIRDGTRVDATLEVGQRFGDAFEASFGGSYDRRFADQDKPVVPSISGRVFDLAGQSAFARAAYDITPQWQLGARLAVRRGDVVSTTRPAETIFEYSDAIAADPTFGPDFYAYRLRGTTDTWSLNLSYALSDHASINLGYADARTRAVQGLDYRERATTLLFVANF